MVEIKKTDQIDPTGKDLTGEGAVTLDQKGLDYMVFLSGKAFPFIFKNAEQAAVFAEAMSGGYDNLVIQKAGEDGNG